MINILEKYTKEELLNKFKSFTKKGDIHNFLGISDNSKGVAQIKELCTIIGFDLNYYKDLKKKYCLLCGKELTKWQNKFCSKSHAAIYNNKRKKRKLKESVIKSEPIKEKNLQIPKKRKQSKTIEIICKNCCKHFFKENKNTQFCCMDCSIEYHKNEHYKYYLENQELFCRPEYTPRNYIREHILKEQNNLCDICKCEPIHNGKPLIFILDHIDGNSSNNRRDNLRLICPNCDTQLPTFKSKNKHSYRRNYLRERIIKNLTSID